MCGISGVMCCRSGVMCCRSGVREFEGDGECKRSFEEAAETEIGAVAAREMDIGEWEVMSLCFVCVRMCVCVCVCVLVCVCVYVCMRMCMCVCVYAYVYVRMCKRSLKLSLISFKRSIKIDSASQQFHH